MKRVATQAAFIGESLVTTIKRPKRKAHTDTKKRTRVARFLHLGAGRQSSWIAEMIVEGEIERVDVAIFADTGDEPPWVYAQLEYLRGRLASVGIPLVVVKASEGGIVKDAMNPDIKRFAKMPLFTRDATGKVGRMQRQCTTEYKIGPADDFELNYLLERGHARIVVDKNGNTSRRVARDVYVENLFGISYEEFYRAGNRGAAWQKALYPLIEARMTAADCERDLAARGLPVPKKSSCLICPFHDDAYWNMLKTEAPDEFEHTCRFDDWLRSPISKQRYNRGLHGDVFLYYGAIPLREVDFAERLAAHDAGRIPMFELELCGDHCMT